MGFHFRCSNENRTLTAERGGGKRRESSQDDFFIMLLVDLSSFYNKILRLSIRCFVHNEDGTCLNGVKGEWTVAGTW